MNLGRQFTLGFKSLMLHKLRSLLTMLGVVFGVAAVIAGLSVGEGARKEQIERIRQMGANKILIQSVRPSTEDRSAAETNSYESSYGLLYADQVRIEETMPSVKRTVGVRVFPQRKVRFQNRLRLLRAAAAPPSWFQAINQPFIAGEPFNIKHEEDAARVCVLSEDAARRLMFFENTIGEKVSIGDETYTVVGIVARGGLNGSRDEPADIIIPVSTSIEALGETITIIFSGGRIRERVDLHQIIVETNDTDSVIETAEAISWLLGSTHEKADYAIDVPLALLQEEEATQRRFAIMLGSISVISLIVGGIGIMNIMLASVTERTREIGVRRAIGAKRVHIVTQFLIETVMLSITGGIIGVIAGYLLPMGIQYAFQFPTHTPAYAVYISLGISVMVGVLAGLYPAVRASQLDPIKALRHE